MSYQNYGGTPPDPLAGWMLFTQFLSTDGLGGSGGNFSATGNYTGAAEDTPFYFQPGPNESANLFSMVGQIVGSGPLIFEEFGDILLPAGDGVLVRKRTGVTTPSDPTDGTVEVDFSDGVRIASNGDFQRYTFNATWDNFQGGNPDGFSFQWLGQGSSVMLRGALGDCVDVIFKGNYTGLIDCTMLVQGIRG